VLNCLAESATKAAYRMCAGVTNAASPTRGTIAATLLSTGTVSSTLPTIIASSITTGTITLSRTTSLSTTTTSAITQETSSTATQSSAASSSEPTWATLPPSDGTEENEEEESSNSSKLSSKQVVGIVFGCVAVVIFGILMVLLARCVRQKRMGDLEAAYNTGFAKLRESVSMKRKISTSTTPNLPPLEISSPIPRIRTPRNTDNSLPWHTNAGLGVATISSNPVPKPPSATNSHSGSPAPATTIQAVSATAATGEEDARKIPQIMLSSATSSPSIKERRQSPPKPTLTINIPKVSTSNPAMRIPDNKRESVVTEFAEDGEDLPPGTPIWRPPVTDPQSATTFYFADKAGNWVLRHTSNRQKMENNDDRSRRPPVPRKNTSPKAGASQRPLVGLPGQNQPTEMGSTNVHQDFSPPSAAPSPLRVPSKLGKGKLGSPIAFKDQRRKTTLSSPDPSLRLSQTAETLESPPPVNNSSNNNGLGLMGEGRSLTRGESQQRPRAARRVSESSATSIESAAAEDIVGDGRQDGQGLSPVVEAESPKTPISPGKSPVKYPKIPKPSNNGVASGQDFTPAVKQYSWTAWNPSKHPNAIGNGVLPKHKRNLSSAKPDDSSNWPWNAPEPGPACSRKTSHQWMASRDNKKQWQNHSTLEQQYWEHQRQIGNPASYWNQETHSTRRYDGPEQRQPTPPRQQRDRTPPPPQQDQQQPFYRPYQSYHYSSETQHHDKLQHQLQRFPVRPAQLPTPAPTPQMSMASSPALSSIKLRERDITPNTMTTAISTSPRATPSPKASTAQTSPAASSLLAKRRGAEKAAALTLYSNGGRNSSSESVTGKRTKWVKEGSSPSSQKQPSSAPAISLLSGGGATESVMVVSPLSEPDHGLYGPVPITPGWVPELTPTRRGDDLVLDVK